MMVPIFVLAFIGISVQADQSIAVTAEVSKDPPPYPPVIESPTSGQQIAGPVTISGQCPLQDPAVYVSVMEGSNVLGTTTCDNNTGTFSIQISVPYGSHTIYTQVVSFTGTLGHSSTPVSFTSVFTPASAGITPAQYAVIKQNPLVFLSGQGVVPFGSAMDAIWRGTINGGTAPYKVHVSWGDGSTSNYTVYDQTQQAFQHHFVNLGSYTMIFTVTDSAGQTTTLRVIAASALPAAASLASDSQPQPVWYQRLVQSDIVKAYGTVLFAIVTVWFFRRRHDTKRKSHHHPYRPAHI